MMPCLDCGNKLIWIGDNTINEFGGYGEGIVHSLECKNKQCSISEVLVYRRWENGE